MLGLFIKGVTEGSPVVGRGVSSPFFVRQRWMKAADLKEKSTIAMEQGTGRFRNKIGVSGDERFSGLQK